MFDGTIVAAYLAVTLTSEEGLLLPDELISALGRLAACVTAKVGAGVTSRLLSDPRWTAVKEVGSQLEEAARMDQEFAHEVSLILDELERGGAHFLVQDALAWFGDYEAAIPADRTKWTDEVPCQVCGEANSADSDFCHQCGAYLGWDGPGNRFRSTGAGLTQWPIGDSGPATYPNGEPLPSASPGPALSRKQSHASELPVRAVSFCQHCGYRIIDGRLPVCGNCNRPLDVRDALPSASSPYATPHGGEGSVGVAPPGGTASMQTVIDRALSDVVTHGRVLFNPPERMRQGQVERIEVAIARARDLDEVLKIMVRGRGPADLSDVETSPFMTVELRGHGFDVTPLQVESGAEQLLRPTALWEFDVLPKRSGYQTLQLCVAMRIPLPNRPDERVSIPVLERPVKVAIDPRYGSRQFLKMHWQWVIATAAGLGGAVAAWLKFFHGGE